MPYSVSYYRKAKTLRGRKGTLAPEFFIAGGGGAIPPPPPPPPPHLLPPKIDATALFCASVI